MAQSHSQSQPLDPLSLTLRDTDSALPAAPWQVEELIDEAAVPGQERTGSSSSSSSRWWRCSLQSFPHMDKRKSSTTV